MLGSLCSSSFYVCYHMFIISELKHFKFLKLHLSIQLLGYAYAKYLLASFHFLIVLLVSLCLSWTFIVDEIPDNLSTWAATLDSLSPFFVWHVCHVVTWLLLIYFLWIIWLLFRKKIWHILSCQFFIPRVPNRIVEVVVCLILRLSRFWASALPWVGDSFPFFCNKKLEDLDPTLIFLKKKFLYLEFLSFLFFYFGWFIEIIKNFRKAFVNSRAVIALSRGS